MQRILAGLLVLGVSGAAFATPVTGQSVIYRYDSTHSYAATVAHANGDGTADLVIYNWYPYNFGFGLSSLYGAPATYLQGVTEGTTDNRWTANPDVLSQADIDDAVVDLLEQPGAPVSAGLTLGGAGVQFSATRATRLNVRITTSLSSTLLGPQSYTVELRCDSGSTPTTVVDDVIGGLSGVVATVDQPAKLSALVPAGHYCRVVTAAASANATPSLTASTKQTL